MSVSRHPVSQVVSDLSGSGMLVVLVVMAFPLVSGMAGESPPGHADQSLGFVFALVGLNDVEAVMAEASDLGEPIGYLLLTA